MATTKAFECQPASQCEYLRGQPGLEVMLFLRVNKQKRIDPVEGQISYSPAEADHNRRCLAQYLNALGLRTNIEGGIVETLQDVEVWGPFARLVATVAPLDSVWDVEVVCRDRAPCAACARLDPIDCAAHPLCGPARAFRHDGERRCYQRAPFACVPFDTLCSGARPFGARDQQGVCWVIDQACTSVTLDGWQRDDACLSGDPNCPPP